MTSPNDPATTPTEAWTVRSRFAGAAAIAFATLVMAENVLFGATGALGYGDPIEDVLAYYAANRTTISVIAGLVALYLPLLLVFVTGLHGLVEHRGGNGSNWSRLAMAAAATASATLVLVNVAQMTLTLAAGGLAEPTASIEVLWRLHSAAFALTLPMLGATGIGITLATHASGLTPAWQRLLGLASGGLLLAAGLGSVAIADGSALIYVGLLGFFAWLVWLVVTGLRLVRA